MGKTSYKNTTELVNEIASKLDDLNSGNLSISELDDLVNSGKDLYEHLIILRYKAFDQHGEPVQEEVVIEEEPAAVETEEPEVSPFDFSGFSEPEETVEEEEDQPIFDLTGDVSAVEEVEEPVAVEETIEEAKEEETKEEPTLFEEDPSNSLHDVLKQEEDEVSLRKQLQNSPVSDLKSHISIAKKFEYISNMFGGDSEAYEEAIDFLNTCATGNDARLKLNEYTTKYTWNLEDKSIVKFIELVERRYL